jgi:hypothetical protein
MLRMMGRVARRDKLSGTDDIDDPADAHSSTVVSGFSLTVRFLWPVGRRSFLRKSTARFEHASDQRRRERQARNPQLHDGLQRHELERMASGLEFLSPRRRGVHRDTERADDVAA